MTTTMENHQATPNDEFVRLLTSSHRCLLGYLTSLLGNREDAEDVLQRASVIMWRRFDSFEPGTDFLAWSSTVCFYEAKNFQRLAARSKLVFNDALLDLLSQERLSDLQHQDRRIEALHSCLARLDPENRNLLEKFYLDRSAIGDLAIQLGRAPQTLYNKLNALRRLLAVCIRQHTTQEVDA